jgi:hypothetical protein
MPNRAVLAAATVLVTALATPVAAQTVAGSYEVKFEEMSTNCDPVRFTYTRGQVKVDTGKSSLRVNIDAIRREMTGVPQKSGKINAKTPKKVATTVDGIDAKYAISGRVDDSGVLELVLVGEFFFHDNGKPLCTQSWNLRGVRQAASEKPAGNKTQKKSVPVLAAFQMMPASLED